MNPLSEDFSAEVYPTSVRATGHGISAGVAKLGAFIGVFVFPVLNATLGLRGTLLITFGFALIGVLLTMLLPEPNQMSLEELEDPGSKAKMARAVNE